MSYLRIPPNLLIKGLSLAGKDVLLDFTTVDVTAACSLPVPASTSAASMLRRLQLPIVSSLCLALLNSLVDGVCLSRNSLQTSPFLLVPREDERTYGLESSGSSPRSIPRFVPSCNPHQHQLTNRKFLTDPSRALALV